MSAPKLQERVRQALATIKQADADLYEAQREAQRRRDQRAAPGEALLSELKEEFLPSAFQLACRAGVAPYSRAGTRLGPDDIDVDDDGVLLRWDAERWAGPSYLATWEALVQESRGA